MIVTYRGAWGRRRALAPSSLGPWTCQPPRAARGACAAWARAAWSTHPGSVVRAGLAITTKGRGDAQTVEGVPHVVLQLEDGTIVDPSHRQFLGPTAVYLPPPGPCLCGRPRLGDRLGHEVEAGAAPLDCEGRAPADIFAFLRRVLEGGSVAWVDEDYLRPYGLYWLPEGP